MKKISRNITGDHIKVEDMELIRDAMWLMTEHSWLELDAIVEKFRSSRGLIAIGFESFGEDDKAGDVVQIFKKEVSENPKMLRDVEQSLIYAMMYMTKKRRGPQDIVPWIIDTAQFIYTVFGNKFFWYILERRTRWLKASTAKLKKIIEGTDDRHLIKAMNMPEKTAALQEMIDNREFDRKLKTDKSLKDGKKDSVN